MCKLLEKAKKIEWWETSYLMIYALILSYKFLQTTMFPIPWPSYMNYACGLVIGAYVAIKFLCKRKDYTKKELLLMVLVLVALVLPAIVAHYSFLFLLAFLMVGAKDIDYRKILIVYLVVGVTIMVLAFSASQYGFIEDLTYVRYRGEEEFVRHSYGILYTTDYAAHLFYMVLATVILFSQKLNVIGKIWISILVALSVYWTSNAQTSAICLILFAVLCVLERLLRNYMRNIEKVTRFTPVICASGFFLLADRFDGIDEWMLKIDEWLSNRLYYSKKALEWFGPKIFGQYIIESGNGLSETNTTEYFFIDDSYLRIFLQYGYIAFFVIMILLILLSKKAAEQKQYMIVIALIAISIHSVMEHHLMDLEYNPLWLALFATLGEAEPKQEEKTIHASSEKNTAKC